MILPLQNDIVYGPVNSRRLGRSLGINVLPSHCKVCTFDCIYCQYGWTKIRGEDIEEKKLLPGASEILNAVERSLRMIVPRPSYITFSGNGEPTLHPSFGGLVEGIIELRDRYAPQSKTAILSNSTTAGDMKIRRAISRLDVKIMKLDCGSENGFRQYNRPFCGIKLEDVVSGLRLMKGITIQALLSGGAEGNYDQDELDAWVGMLKRISPLHVQLYTLDRGYPSDRIIPLDKKKLSGIKKRLNRENLDAEVYY